MKTNLPASLVRCSDPEHARSPMHQPWILADNGETYCAAELGKIRGTEPPQGPINQALTRMGRDYDEESDEWQRHLQDLVSLDTFKWPVQASNGETFEKFSFIKLLSGNPGYRDVRNPVRIPIPARVIPNRAVQRLATMVAGSHGLSQPQDIGESVEQARRDYAVLCDYEADPKVQKQIVQGRPPPEWRAHLNTADSSTEDAVAQGALELETQVSALAQRELIALQEAYHQAWKEVWRAALCTGLGVTFHLIGGGGQVNERKNWPAIFGPALIAIAFVSLSAERLVLASLPLGGHKKRGVSPRLPAALNGMAIGFVMGAWISSASQPGKDIRYPDPAFSGAFALLGLVVGVATSGSNCSETGVIELIEGEKP